MVPAFCIPKGNTMVDYNKTYFALHDVLYLTGENINDIYIATSREIVRLNQLMDGASNPKVIKWYSGRIENMHRVTQYLKDASNLEIEGWKVTPGS